MIAMIVAIVVDTKTTDDHQDNMIITICFHKFYFYLLLSCHFCHKQRDKATIMTPIVMNLQRANTHIANRYGEIFSMYFNGESSNVVTPTIEKACCCGIGELQVACLADWLAQA